MANSESVSETAPELPRSDRRFKDAKWRETPLFALIHQTYLMLSEQLSAMAEQVDGLTPEKKDQLRFVTKVVTDALSPANFPLTNRPAWPCTDETGKLGIS